MRPSARKSYGDYKPVIIHPTGRTEIVGKRGHVQRVEAQTKHYEGPTEIYHARRGMTFETRDEAVRFAQGVINRRSAFITARQGDRETRQRRYAEQRAKDRP